MNSIQASTSNIDTLMQVWTAGSGWRDHSITVLSAIYPRQTQLNLGFTLTSDLLSQLLQRLTINGPISEQERSRILRMIDLVSPPSLFPTDTCDPLFKSYLLEDRPLSPAYDDAYNEELIEESNNHSRHLSSIFLESVQKHDTPFIKALLHPNTADLISDYGASEALRVVRQEASTGCDAESEEMKQIGSLPLSIIRSILTCPSLDSQIDPKELINILHWAILLGHSDIEQLLISHPIHRRHIAIGFQHFCPLEQAKEILLLAITRGHLSLFKQFYVDAWKDPYYRQHDFFEYRTLLIQKAEEENQTEIAQLLRDVVEPSRCPPSAFDAK